MQYYSCYGVLTYNNTLIEGSKRNYVKQTPPRRRASFLYINSSKLTCETSQPSVSSIDRFLVSPYIRSPRFILLAGKDSTRFDEVDCFFHSRKKRCALFIFSPFPVLFWPFLGQLFCPRELVSWGYSIVAGAGMGARGGRGNGRRRGERRSGGSDVGVSSNTWRASRTPGGVWPGWW